MAKFYQETNYPLHEIARDTDIFVDNCALHIGVNTGFNKNTYSFNRGSASEDLFIKVQALGFWRNVVSDFNLDYSNRIFVTKEIYDEISFVEAKGNGKKRDNLILKLRENQNSLKKVLKGRNSVISSTEKNVSFDYLSRRNSYFRRKYNLSEADFLLLMQSVFTQSEKGKRVSIISNDMRLFHSWRELMAKRRTAFEDIPFYFHWSVGNFSPGENYDFATDRISKKVVARNLVGESTSFS